jgi:hypothetical protein
VKLLAVDRACEAEAFTRQNPHWKVRSRHRAFRFFRGACAVSRRRASRRACPRSTAGRSRPRWS